MTAVTHNDDLYYYVLFALLQIGNPQDYEKKIKDICRGGTARLSGQRT